ncbi:MAG: hypothetical protein ACRD6B_18905 [Bryobacteraceae bacterium]
MKRPRLGSAKRLVEPAFQPAKASERPLPASDPAFCRELAVIGTVKTASA